MKEKIKKIIKKIVIAFIILSLMLVISTMLDEQPTFADSGFSTSYDSGGSWDSDSSWDDYSSWDDDSSWDDSDSSYRRNNRNYNNSGKTSAKAGFIIKICIFLLIILVVDKILHTVKDGNQYAKRNMVVDNDSIEDQIKQYISNFNKEEFLNNGYKIYCDVQEAWMNFKLENVKDIITDELYNMYESQLTTLEVKGEQNIMKDFKLKRSFLKDVTKQNDTVTITTGYIIEFYDYIIDRATGSVKRGTNNKKMRVTYEMKFRQSLDESNKVTKCPNCGADIEMNTSGVCVYCHTKLVTENTKWVLTEKKSLDQEFIY